MSHVIDDLGGTGAVARMCEVTAPSVTFWRTRGIPIERCVAIERNNDRGVKRWHLRPADWHLIWPELIGAPGAPEVPQADQAKAA